MPLSLTFHGGAGTVTGSRFELAVENRHFLIDCGLFQGLRALRDRNWAQPGFDARHIEAVLITHAHIDHTGYLPRLMKAGFRGPIYCTDATLELAPLLLLDAARLQEEDADYANRKGFSKHHPALPLFDENDAKLALSHMRAVRFGQQLDLGPVRARFHQAGHILGSAFIEIHAHTDAGATSIVFSGDLGRPHKPLHPDPEPLVGCDTLVLESTYGDRVHEQESFERQVAGAFRVALRRGGTILIPAFAVARAQIVTLMLGEMMDRGEIPRVPIHIDSPMAVDVTGIYRRHVGTKDLDPLPAGHSRLFPAGVQFHHTVEESKALNRMAGPRIIISASGMMTGGRVLHHLERLLPDRRNLVVLVGFQAAGTRGRALQEGAQAIRMHGQDIPVHAQVLEAHGLSAHADRNEIAAWVRSAPHPPQNVFLVHGEPEAVSSLSGLLARQGLHPVAPSLGQRFTYDRRTNRWRLAGP